MSTPPPSQAGSPASDPRSSSGDHPKSTPHREGVAAGKRVDFTCRRAAPGSPVADCRGNGSGVDDHSARWWRGHVDRTWLGQTASRYLRKLRPGLCRSSMAETRQGNRGSLPFDPVDPRDVKYYRNQDTYWWAESDDPFAWRDGLPFVRVGLAELVLIGGGFVVLAVLLGLLWWPLALPPLVLSGLVAWFFRNPSRQIPEQVGNGGLAGRRKTRPN